MPVNTDIIMSTAMRKSNTCKFLCNRTCKTHIYHTFVSLQNGFYALVISGHGDLRRAWLSAEGRELGNQAGTLVIGEIVKFVLKLESICSDLSV